MTGQGYSAAYETRPLEDSRRSDFLLRHPRSSVFHTTAWLEALQRTYRYNPIVFTTSPPGAELANGLVFCRVNSWLTGRRLVAVPFSDHCDPLVTGAEHMQSLLVQPEHEVLEEGALYVELRSRTPTEARSSLLRSDYHYWLHEIDLTPDLDTIFRKCPKDSTQRKIRRAERERLGYDEGPSDALLDALYGLLLKTRHRHEIPPQPKCWFKNLVICFGDALKIRLAFRDLTAAAAIITISHKDCIVYKYGCSDTRFHSLGAVHMLFWKTILEGKRKGSRVFELGRSEFGNGGLVTFKDRWGGVRSVVTYTRFSASKQSTYRGAENWKERAGKSIFAHPPERLLRLAGELAYRHVGERKLDSLAKRARRDSSGESSLRRSTVCLSPRLKRLRDALASEVPGRS